MSIIYIIKVSTVADPVIQKPAVCRLQRHAQSKEEQRLLQNEVSSHQKVAWWVHAIMRWRSQCVGWSGYLNSFDCWQLQRSRLLYSNWGSQWTWIEVALLCLRQPVVKGNPALCYVCEAALLIWHSWKWALVSSSTSATKQWWCCMSWKPPQ